MGKIEVILQTRVYCVLLFYPIFSCFFRIFSIIFGIYLILFHFHRAG